MNRPGVRLIWRWWLRVSFVGIALVTAYVLVASLVFADWKGLGLGGLGCLVCANSFRLWKRGEI